MDKVIITRNAVGICFMQVCSEKDATDEEILTACNAENPSGTSLGWCRVIRQPNLDSCMESKKSAPIYCDKYPDRVHYLVSC